MSKKLIVANCPDYTNFSMPHCYILKSIKSSKYYIGATEDIGERFRRHNAGLVRSTKSDRPWKLIHVEDFIDFRDARKREFQIKSWKSRAAIEKLI